VLWEEVEMSELELAWAAGLFEGEGTISINKAHTKTLGMLRCMVGNTDKEIVDFFLQRWGGHWHEVKASGHKRTAWKWSVAAKKAARFIADIAPYLRTTRVKEKAALGLEYQAQKSLRYWVRRSNEYRATQLSYYIRMKELNVRGNH
jgi:hypothetical protein